MTIELAAEGPDSFEFTPDLGPAGGYAFPHKPSRTESVGMGMFLCHPGDQPGMTLRAHIATEAMAAIIATDPPISFSTAAKMAVKHADALLLELGLIP